MAPRNWSHKCYSCFPFQVFLSQCLHLMHSEVAWILVSSATKIQPQIILKLGYLLDYLVDPYYSGPK